MLLSFLVSKLRKSSLGVKWPATFMWPGTGGTQWGLRAAGFNALAISPRVLTRPTGPVALGGEAGVAAAHLVDGNDPELVIDIWGQLEDGRVDTARELGMVMPDPRLELVLFELDNVI